MFWTGFLFLMELMVDHVYNSIQFGLIILLVGAPFVVWVTLSPTFSDFNPTRVLDADNGQIPA